MLGSDPWVQRQRLSQNLLSPSLVCFLHEKRIPVTCFGFFIWRIASCTNMSRKTSPPVGTDVVRYLLSQPALQLGLRTGPRRCQANAPRSDSGARAGGDQSSPAPGAEDGGVQGSGGDSSTSRFWGVVRLVPQRSALNRFLPSTLFCALPDILLRGSFSRN